MIQTDYKSLVQMLNTSNYMTLCDVHYYTYTQLKFDDRCTLHLVCTQSGTSHCTTVSHGSVCRDQSHEQFTSQTDSHNNFRPLCKKGMYQFLADFHFLQDQANFSQTDLF